MNLPKQSNPKQPQRQARAPYNFVPLPEMVIDLPRIETPRQFHDCFGLPDQDRFHLGRHTGRIDCVLSTLSPLYTRCLMRPDFLIKWEKKLEELHTDEEAQQAFAQFFNHGQVEQPIIPGSSLRGMTRALMEIVAQAHLRWVDQSSTFAFRAVAAARQDPLRQPYEIVLGRFGSNVQAGYFYHDESSGGWYIQPALTPAELGWVGRDKSYLKVSERDLVAAKIKNLRRFDDPKYKPAWHPVHFNVASMRGATLVSDIADYGAPYRNVGVLVCSGNMMENTGNSRANSSSRRVSPRRNYALVLAPNRNKQRIPIDKQAVRDYLNSLSPFQKELEEWGGKDFGCLREGAPVFFVKEQDKNGRDVVRYFGHDPNFRIPARLEGETRAATPFDFVPKALREGNSPDLVDAIFGWVDKSGKASQDSPDPKNKSNQRAGRIFFGDARFRNTERGLWYDPLPVTVRTLSEPKPTTFQHYLVQDAIQKHDPDNLVSLAHLGSSPDETMIRGYKLYWTKGENPPIRATSEELKHPKQLTKIRPIQAGVQFDFSIRFENLNDVELGALLWVLQLPTPADKKYSHRIGMGKSLGMGAVTITPTLYLDDRTKRYTNLFASSNWQLADSVGAVEPFLHSFEQFVLRQTNPNVLSLAELPRIKTLLTLLEWREGEPSWLEMTRYMEIEHGLDKLNEYKERPVLPTPEHVARNYPTKSISPSSNRQANNRPPQDKVPSKQEPYHLQTVLVGTVESFGHGPKRSYGFIRYQKNEREEESIFVHRNQLTKGTPTLTAGDRVRFIKGVGPNGDEAQHVCIDE